MNIHVYITLVKHNLGLDVYTIKRTKCPPLGAGDRQTKAPEAAPLCRRGRKVVRYPFANLGPRKRKGTYFDPFLPNVMFGQNRRVNVSLLTGGCITVGCQPRGTYTGKRCRRHPRAPSRARRHARRAMAPEM